MTIEIAPADFSDPTLAAFIAAHLHDMAPTAPPESRHALAVDALRGNGIRLWTLTDAGALRGTVALAELESGHEELKSMRVDPQARGRGFGARMLRFVVDDARSRGISRVSLETGSQEFFAPARALYEAHGFERCVPFGNYRADEHSVFYTRGLG